MRDFDPTASEFISTGYLTHSRPGARHYDPMSIGTAVAGPLISSALAPDQPARSNQPPIVPANQRPENQPGQGGGNNINNNMGVMGLIGQASGGIRGANAAHHAAGVLSAASDSATNQQTAFYNQNRNDLNPYMSNGANASTSLNSLLASGQLGGQFTGADYLANKDPGYDFQLQQGNQALQNSQAAHDGVMSGAAMKGMIDYNQGMASTGYHNAYQRWLSTQQNTYGQLSNTANMGSQAAGHLASVGQNYSNHIADSITASGSATASGIMGYANAMNNGMQGGMQGLGMAMGPMSSLMRDMFGRGLNGGGRGGGGNDQTDFNGWQYGENQNNGTALGPNGEGGAGGNYGGSGDYGMNQQQNNQNNPYSNEGNNYQQQDPNAQQQDPNYDNYNPAYLNY